MNLHTESPFWTSNLGRLLPIITMLAGFFTVILNNDRRMGKQESNIDTVANSVRQLTEYVGRIDVGGTQFSRIGIQRDTDMVLSNTRRIETVEKGISEIGPKVERIDVNLNWITQWIQTQEAAKRRN